MRTREKFRAIVADPPWEFRDKLPGETRGAGRQYATMADFKIDNYLERIGHPVHDDALLFMWRVSAMVEEAYATVRAWGFVPKSEIVWKKLTPKGNPHFGMGRYVRATHETCIIARRGRGAVRDHGVRSMFEAPVGRHSEKPEIFFDIVERLADGPFCELFARRRREGWTCYGNEL